MTNETVREVCEEMRADRQFYGAEFCALADRIEAAHEREMAANGSHFEDDSRENARERDGETAAKNYWAAIRNAVYDLRLHNDDQTVIERIKCALNNVTFAFYKCEFKGAPWPKEVMGMEREWISKALRLIWDGEGNYTEGYENETDAFLDGLGIPKRERKGLIRTRRDCEGMVCAQCGKVGRTVVGPDRRILGCENVFRIFPDGRVLCYECDSHNNLYGEEVAK